MYPKIVKILIQKLSLKMAINLLMKWVTILPFVNNLNRVSKREFWINN